MEREIFSLLRRRHRRAPSETRSRAEHRQLLPDDAKAPVGGQQIHHGFERALAVTALVVEELEPGATCPLCTRFGSADPTGRLSRSHLAGALMGLMTWGIAFSTACISPICATHPLSESTTKAAAGVSATPEIDHIARLSSAHLASIAKRTSSNLEAFRIRARISVRFPVVR